MPWIIAILLSSAVVGASKNNDTDSPDACTTVINSTKIDDCLRNIKNDTVLCFANHSQWYEVTTFFIIANLKKVTIQGPAYIKCNKGVGLVFYKINTLNFQNVTIKQCGLKLTNDKLSNITKDVQTSPYQFKPGIKVGIFLIQSVNVTFQEVTISETQGIGLVCINPLNHLDLTDVTFQHNQPNDIEECKYCLFPYNGSAKCIFNPESVSGSLLLLYLDCNQCDDNNDTNTNINITRAKFIDNFSCSVISLVDIQPIIDPLDKLSRNIPTTAGVEIILAQSKYTVNITINSSNFTNNTGLVGSGLNIEMFESAPACEVIIQHCIFSNNGQLNSSLFPASVPSYGGAVSVIPYIPSTNHSAYASHLLNISNCLFHNNYAVIGGAVFVPNVHAMFNESTNLKVNITKCSFTNNIGVLGHGMYVSGLDYFSMTPTVCIAHCNFSNNAVNDSYSSLANPNSFGVVYLSQITALLSHTVFINNTGTSINLALSSLLMEGDIFFKDNSAISGGALYLQYYSFLVFCNNSRVQFVNNAASTVGGAIFYEHKFNPASHSFTNCFIYFNTFDPFCVLRNTCYSEKMNITVNFTDNKAGYATSHGSTGYGSAIYGAGLYCPWLVKNNVDFSTINITRTLSEDFGNVLIFSPKVTNEYVIATASKDIHASISDIDTIPGQIVTVYLNATDHYDRPAIDTVTASMISRQFKERNNFSVDVSTSGYQLLQGDTQTAVEIQINGPENRSSAVIIYSLYAGTQLKIPVHTMKCQLGFVYNATQHTCLCNANLLNRGVTCDYHTGYLKKPHDKWIGVLENDIVVFSCVYDYCTGLELVDPKNLDDQCKDNRGGLLCGGCRDGYYAKIGHGGCGHCEGVSNLLLYVTSILLTGAWLVFVTAFLHVYISDGYLYGIFFYANMVFLFRNQIYSTFRHLHKEYLYAFFNLQGIYDICVYKNVDTLALAGLNFVFPLYLLLIMVCLTLIARCRGPYNRNRFRYSTTKVFATLLYICYYLLVDFSFLLLTFKVIETPSGKETRWELDPNIRYYSGLHGLLATVSILCLIILFTVALILLFPKQAYKFKIIQKLKPLLDAFQAPFKLKYSFWIGLRLVLRITLHVIAYAVPDDYMLYTAGCILCLLLYAQSVCSPYANSKINALDNFFILLLIMQFIEALSHPKLPVIVIACEAIFILIYFICVIRYIVHRFPKIYKSVIAGWEKIILLVSRSHRRQYTEINSFAEDYDKETKHLTQQEPFETSIRTQYASVPTTSIPDIPEPVDHSRFRESMLEVVDNGN